MAHQLCGAVDSPTLKRELTVDVIVVGAGPGGYSTAITAAKNGCSVLLLERAEKTGGTALKAAAWFWIPNNSYMRAMGISDPKDAALRYMARLARPDRYRPSADTLGLAAWEYEALSRFYDSGPAAIDALTSWGALQPCPFPEFPDYYGDFPEDEAPHGRVMVPNRVDEAAGSPGDGQDLIERFRRSADEIGIVTRTGHRVVAVTNHDGRVDGVVAETASGTVSIGARNGVVFATGGFTHHAGMRQTYMPGPVFGGCAALTNTGDFISIAGTLGAPLANMNNAWLASMPVDWALSPAPTTSSTFLMAGDSMILVNKYGRRVVNEKTSYNELGKVFHTWDPYRAEYPNLLLVMIWDSGTQEHFSGTRFGNPVTPLDGDRSHILSSDTLGGLATAVQSHLAEIADSTGGLELDPDFSATLNRTIAEFNSFATEGSDRAFHRGEGMLEQFNYGEPRPGNTAAPSMFPISGTGPFYATLMASSTLDTKGGPRSNTDGQVLNQFDAPIPGLYGVGNCVASPSGQAYWGGGATIGPIIAFGHLAGLSVACVSPESATL